MKSSLRITNNGNNEPLKVKLELICPFCHEDDFDMPGLKHHLTSGHCEQWNETPELDAGYLTKLKQHEQQAQADHNKAKADFIEDKPTEKDQ